MPFGMPFRRRRPVRQESAVQPEIREMQVAREPTIQPEEIRNLGELIRKRYELDIQIWGLRDVGPRDRHIVEEKMCRSDAILSKIQRTVSSWDSPHAFESEEDWYKMKDIRTRMEAEGKRNWTTHPPWMKDRRVGS